MIQYFTYRLLPVKDGWNTPDQVFRTCFPEFKGKFTYSLETVTNNRIDGRRIGWIETEDATIIDEIIFCMAAFGARKVKTEDAAVFAGKLREGKTPSIVDGKLEFAKEVYKFDELK